jgi:thiol:disulfide interchange protein DsbD
VLVPAALELVDHAAPQRWRQGGGALLVSQAASPYLHGEPGPVEVVLRPGEGRPVALTLEPGGPAPGGEPAPALGGLAPALALAAAGGLLLNLMPCVFPILSLKALALARGGGAVRAEGVAYAAGVVASFLAVAGLLLALRAAGAQVGWGFQLQSPWLVALLAWLMFGLGLALSGLWAPGARWMGAGGRLAAGGGLPGAFATGVLAVVVASPCTAPFMGPALGYAVTRPALEALAVFAALGLGMAAPFLALAASPALARRLPRPGPWMETLKQLLAFPLYLTAVWLVWVLAHQAGPDGAALTLSGMVVLAAMLWVRERWRGRAPLLRGAVAVAGGAALLAILLAPPVAREAPRPGVAAGDPARPFDREAIAAAVAEGRMVLVNMTAAWCITCLVNERVALDTAAVRARLAAPDVVYMKGDWTRRDPAITAYLESWGRNGVPLYVVYAPGRAPQVLPQMLTPDLVLEALGS